MKGGRVGQRRNEMTEVGGEKTPEWSHPGSPAKSILARQVGKENPPY